MWRSALPLPSLLHALPQLPRAASRGEGRQGAVRQSQVECAQVRAPVVTGVAVAATAMLAALAVGGVGGGMRGVVEISARLVPGGVAARLALRVARAAKAAVASELVARVVGPFLPRQATQEWGRRNDATGGTIGSVVNFASIVTGVEGA